MFENEEEEKRADGNNMRMATLPTVVWAAVVAGLALAAHAAWHDNITPKRNVKLGECSPLLHTVGWAGRQERWDGFIV